ncbi:MAG: TraR/DksA C4-type zinc finger protein [Thermoleophilia bacterium]|jgi:DnaK suppressor protein|nr:TraR/DksA C4-type zinc finger protein [Thermoleophilia bacterium]
MELAVPTTALSAERARIAQDLEQYSIGAGRDRDRADRLGTGSDDAVATLEDELDEGVIDDLQANLEEVDAALSRIAAGSYGVCIDCGEAIPEKRLTALPASARCIECQRKQEHR